MDLQETILRNCVTSNHPGRRCEVSMSKAETIYVCVDCWNASVDARRAARKAELDALPRCTCCNRRATVTVYGAKGLALGFCGQHFNRINAAHYRRTAAFPLIGTVLYGRDALLEMARTGR